jgi:hypothetical protein
MLVYLAGALGAPPDDVETFSAKAREIIEQPSADYLQAIEHLLKLVQEAGPNQGRGYRQRLLALARDWKVVSRRSDAYPLNAAKSAILTALDY